MRSMPVIFITRITHVDGREKVFDSVFTSNGRSMFVLTVEDMADPLTDEQCSHHLLTATYAAVSYANLYLSLSGEAVQFVIPDSDIQFE